VAHFGSVAIVTGQLAVFDRPLSEKPQHALEDLISETLAKSLLASHLQPASE